MLAFLRTTTSNPRPRGRANGGSQLRAHIVVANDMRRSRFHSLSTNCPRHIGCRAIFESTTSDPGGSAREAVKMVQPRSSDGAGSSSICGLVRRDDARCRRIQLNSWPCAKKREYSRRDLLRILAEFGGVDTCRKELWSEIFQVNSSVRGPRSAGRSRGARSRPLSCSYFISELRTKSYISDSRLTCGLDPRISVDRPSLLRTSPRMEPERAAKALTCGLVRNNARKSGADGPASRGRAFSRLPSRPRGSLVVMPRNDGRSRVRLVL
jgi:hypothetical protein